MSASLERRYAGSVRSRCTANFDAQNDEIERSDEVQSTRRSCWLGGSFWRLRSIVRGGGCSGRRRCRSGSVAISFSSRESCENYRATVIDAEKSDSENVYVERYSYSICVQDDDPRLKG